MADTINTGFESVLRGTMHAYGKRFVCSQQKLVIGKSRPSQSNPLGRMCSPYHITANQAVHM